MKNVFDLVKPAAEIVNILAKYNTPGHLIDEIFDAAKEIVSEQVVQPTRDNAAIRNKPHGS
ncbi:hypothetical protein [Paenibacillus sp. NRS-1780]|uniref:hypothetical protein n=1 Tax=Paenibacillus sp. NRS-1780 TaxID=3233904 RepID=UPI003D26A95F